MHTHTHARASQWQPGAGVGGDRFFTQRAHVFALSLSLMHTFVFTHGQTSRPRYRGTEIQMVSSPGEVGRSPRVSRQFLVSASATLILCSMGVGGMRTAEALASLTDNSCSALKKAAPCKTEMCAVHAQLTGKSIGKRQERLFRQVELMLLLMS